MYSSIGGIDQWIEIGGEAPDNPVLLYLHGGPGGASSLTASVFKSWERHFTVVHWDQRGAGRTFARNGEAGCGPLTIERMISDTIEVAEFLVHRLGRDKLVVLGHSWGSVLGAHLVKRRPDLVAAFIGTGQVVNMRRNEEYNYARQLAQAHAAGNVAALAALEDIGLASGSGDPPRFQPTSRPANLSPQDIDPLMAGSQFSGDQLFNELCEVDLPAFGLDFAVRMFCFMGTDDQQTAFAPEKPGSPASMRRTRASCGWRAVTTSR